MRKLAQMNPPILLYHAVGPIYIILTAVAVLSTVSPALTSLSSHGKTRLYSNKCLDSNNSKSVGRGLCQQIWNFVLNSNYLSVKKSRFIDFYAIGGIITTIIILINHKMIGGADEDINTKTTTTEHTHCLPAYLLLIHLVRRFFECLWVQKSVSTSRMHVAGYLLGVIHYLCLPLVFEPSRTGAKEGRQIERLMAIVGCLYFQYQQHLHHATLGNLRPNVTKSSGGINSYRIPKGDWFEFVSCPHYFAEIMIYFMFAILIQVQTDSTAIEDEESYISYRLHTQTHWIVLLWTTTNLSISAARTHEWYVSTFGQAYPCRKKLIPFLW